MVFVQPSVGTERKRVMTSELIMAALASLVGSAVITGLVRVYALRVNLLDIPNQRSSHDSSTPRGGGLSIVVVFLAAVATLWFLGSMERNLAIAFLLGGGLVAGISFVDDHGHVSAKWRFLVQIMAAAQAMYFLGGLPEVQIGNTVFNPGAIGYVLTVTCLVWFINAFNFMDGIDGIAATEAICIAGGALVLTSIGGGASVLILLATLTMACLGFLVWNWPPAKIFMGDVGSGFVGYVLALFAIISSIQGVLPIWCWLILAGVFVVDATVTLVTRVIRGEQWYAAHNSHTYQKASRRLRGHRPVTLAVLGINLVWLLPIAWLASMRPEFGWWLTLVAWMPLIALAKFLKAGHPDAAGVVKLLP